MRHSLTPRETGIRRWLVSELNRNEITLAADRLNQLLVEAGMNPLEEERARSFRSYSSLILRWNSRTNLTAVTEEEELFSRHFVECIACARALPEGIGTLLDFGSGAGLPGIPIALCRREIRVTLAESQGKKAAFLGEAVRVLGLTAQVHAGRGETLNAEFDCVTLRAVDKMAEAVGVAATLVVQGGSLALMTTYGDLPVLKQAVRGDFVWYQTVPLPSSDQRILALGRKKSCFIRVQD